MFRAALGLSAQSNGTPLHVKTGPDGLVISAAMFGLGIRYRLDGSFPEHEFWLPFEFLKETEGNRNDAVLLDPTSDGVVVQWVVDSVPHTWTFLVEDSPGELTLPEVDFTDNTPELLVALSEAARTSASARAKTTTHSAPSPTEEALKHAGEDKYWQEYIRSEAPQHRVILTQAIYLGAMKSHRRSTMW